MGSALQRPPEHSLAKQPLPYSTPAPGGSIVGWFLALAQGAEPVCLPGKQTSGFSFAPGLACWSYKDEEEERCE